jgi:hypothetical protein
LELILCRSDTIVDLAKTRESFRTERVQRAAVRVGVVRNVTMVWPLWRKLGTSRDRLDVAVQRHARLSAALVHDSQQKLQAAVERVLLD